MGGTPLTPVGAMGFGELVFLTDYFFHGIVFAKAHGFGRPEIPGCDDLPSIYAS